MNPTSGQLEALREMIAAGMDRSQKVLNSLLSVSIALEATSVQFQPSWPLPHGHVPAEQRMWAVAMSFNGPLEGDAAVIFSCEDAGRLVGCFTGKGKGIMPIDTLEAGTLSEIGNIVLNGVMGTISDVLAVSLIYQVPSVREGGRSLVSRSSGCPGFVIIKIQVRFLGEDLDAAGEIILCLEERSFLDLAWRNNLLGTEVQ